MVVQLAQTNWENKKIDPFNLLEPFECIACSVPLLLSMLSMPPLLPTRRHNTLERLHLTLKFTSSIRLGTSATSCQSAITAFEAFEAVRSSPPKSCKSLADSRYVPHSHAVDHTASQVSLWAPYESLCDRTMWLEARQPEKFERWVLRIACEGKQSTLRINGKRLFEGAAQIERNWMFSFHVHNYREFLLEAQRLHYGASLKRKVFF